MNRFVVGLSLVGCTVSWPMSTIAQESMHYGVSPVRQGIEDPAANALTYGSSADLQTQPATSPPSNLAPISSNPLNLDAISGSLRANPAANEPPALLSGAVNLPKRETTVQPLEYFQVPGLSGGIKVRIAE